MGKKNKTNEAMVNMITTINGQEESSRKELNMRLNEYIIIVVVALATFGVLLAQISRSKNGCYSKCSRRKDTKH